MLKKFTCGGGVGPEACEEGRAAMAKPQDCSRRRGWSCGTALHQRQRVCPTTSSPRLFTSKARVYFQKDKHKQPTPQTLSLLLSFPNSNFMRVKLILDSWQGNLCVYCVVRRTPFHSSLCVYSSRYKVSFAAASHPLLGLPRVLAQLDMDLAWPWLSRRQFQPSAKVMKEDFVPCNPSFTHIHRGEEAPRGHDGWHLSRN